MDRETIEHGVRLDALEESDRKQWVVLERVTNLEGRATVIVWLLGAIFVALLGAYFKS